MFHTKSRRAKTAMAMRKFVLTAWLPRFRAIAAMGRAKLLTLGSMEVTKAAALRVSSASLMQAFLAGAPLCSLHSSLAIV